MGLGWVVAPGIGTGGSSSLSPAISSQSPTINTMAPAATMAQSGTGWPPMDSG